MSDLLPPNATRAERAVDAASARLDELGVPLRDLWNPARCPLALLPWLAWTLAVETWDSGWPPDLKRRACAEATGVHREKGTVAALRRVLALIGAVYSYSEPAPFVARVEILNSESIALESLADVRAALDRAKRASVRLDIALAAGFAASSYAAAGFGTLQVIRFGSEGAA